VTRPPVVLALDQGADCGYATNGSGRLEWGLRHFRIRESERDDSMRLLRFYDWLAEKTSPPSGPRAELVVHEGVVRFVKDRPNLAGPEYVAAIKLYCARMGIRRVEVPPSSLKAFALPTPKLPKRRKGDPPRPRHDQGKPAMTAAAMARLDEEHACTTLAFDLTDDEADALWLYWYAVAKLIPTEGGACLRKPI